MDIITTVPSTAISDLMVTVIETPPLAWIWSIELYNSNPKPVKGEGIEYSQDKIYNKYIQFEVTYDDPDDEEGTYNGQKIITWGDFEKGFALLAEESPNIFARILSEDYDANDADTWFQFVVLGENVYG